MSESKNWAQGSLINSSWLNAVNTAVFAAMGDSLLNPPTTAAQVRQNLGLETPAQNRAAFAAAAGASLVGYQPAGTGAVATTVQSKLRESVSVLDFGADPTGATDSTAQIGAAAIAASLSGSRLDIPPGIFIVNELTLPENTYLNGTGAQNSNSTSLKTSVFKCTTGAFCISTATLPNTIPGYRIENLTIQGWPGADYGLKAMGTSGFLHNVSVLGITNGVGIRYSFGWRGAVDSIYISNCAVGLLIGFTSEPVNGTTFSSVTIELCTVGLYSFPITSVPQIGNVFNTIIVEGCGATYHTSTWPLFLPLSATFQSDTGMTTSTVQGAIILEQNFYGLWNGIYLEINTGIYFWQGITGYTEIRSGVFEMTEPANSYIGSPIYIAHSPSDITGIRLSWNDAIASALISVASSVDTSTKGLIFNTSGASRPLYYDAYLGSAVIGPGKYNLMLKNSARLISTTQNLTNVVYIIPLTGANLRLPCQLGSIFLFNGLTQNINLDADNPIDGLRITLVAKQDATGGRTIGFAGVTFKVTWSEDRRAHV